MNFVLMYVHDPSGLYLRMLDILIKCLKAKHDYPLIHILSDLESMEHLSGFDAICIPMESRNVYREKTRLLDYVPFLDSFYFLDLDQIVFDKFPDIQSDIAVDWSSSEWLWDGFADKRQEFIAHYGTDKYYLSNIGVFGVSVNERTANLFKLIERHYLEGRMPLSFNKRFEKTAEPYYCIAMTQMRKELAIAKFSGTAYSNYPSTPCFSDMTFDLGRCAVFHYHGHKQLISGDMRIHSALNNGMPLDKEMVFRIARNEI